MQDIISPYQNAFVKGRLISDGTLLAAEVVNFVHRARKTKSVWGVAKIDLFKAYDRLTWPFLERVLVHSGFPPSWV